jgi:hypothetical protein
MWHVLENTLSKMFEIVIIKLYSFEKTFWWSCKYKSRSKKFTCPFGIVPMNSLVRRTNYLSRGSGKWVTSKRVATVVLLLKRNDLIWTLCLTPVDVNISLRRNPFARSPGQVIRPSDKRNFIGTSPNRQVNFLLLYLYLHDHQIVFFSKEFNFIMTIFHVRGHFL